MTSSEMRDHERTNILNQNGIVFFPGSSGVYVGSMLIGGVGIAWRSDDAGTGEPHRAVAHAMDLELGAWKRERAAEGLVRCHVLTLTTPHA